jgi:hypothetical protein
MTPDTLNFNGDAITFLGLIGVLSSVLIIVTSFRRFFNSPYNIRYVKTNESTTSDSGTDSVSDT